MEVAAESCGKLQVSCWRTRIGGRTHSGADDFGAANGDGAGATVLAHVLDAAADDLADFETRRLELLGLLEGKERGEGRKTEGEDVAVILDRIDGCRESL